MGLSLTMSQRLSTSAWTLEQSSSYAESPTKKSTTAEHQYIRNAAQSIIDSLLPTYGETSLIKQSWLIDRYFSKLGPRVRIIPLSRIYLWSGIRSIDAGPNLTERTRSVPIALLWVRHFAYILWRIPPRLFQDPLAYKMLAVLKWLNSAGLYLYLCVSSAEFWVFSLRLRIYI